MRILEYSGLDTASVAAQYRKAAEAIAREDFRAADVKKLVNLGHGKFYRARLDGANRLLFALVRHRGETCALMLEVILNHDYRTSRFLRGAGVDEAKIVDADAAAAAAEAQPVRYLHPERAVVHFLDKPISFDDTQETVYRLPPPLIVVGSAGSGKTALTLEKLKHVDGEVLYVTQSAYLPDRFMLCGDSNQIVHPNFFSWSQVKTLFWRDPQLAERQELRALAANFRNGLKTTRLANALLKIKHRRFGSIDRESNFLVEAVGGEPGTTVLLADEDSAKRDLDRKTGRSTEFAVLVLRDEDKASAREYFSTPLLFSVHEAKGLEYENVVLYRFVSNNRAEYAEIAAGVTRQDLQTDTLDYRRARDKGDKSLEIYKFFVNALYVALTRTVKNLYVMESDTAHPLFGLLDLTVAAGDARVDARQSSVQDWQKEARKLELQGKQEQAEAIRRTILKQAPPPWPVLGEPALRELLLKVFRERAVGEKQKRRLHEYAAFHDEPELAAYLAQEAGFGVAQSGHPQGFEQQRSALRRKYLVPYAGHNFKDVLRQCEMHGIDHRTAMNQTPLMAAAACGNAALVEALLERGADRDAADQYGCNALHIALREAFRDAKFAHGPGAALYELLAPSYVDAKVGERLVRVDKHLTEYFLFQTLWTLFKSRFTRIDRTLDCAIDTKAILKAWEGLPESVLRAARNKRQHLSSVLSRNEVDRNYAYNRALFKRVAHGWYQFNPSLEVRCRSVAGDESWLPIFAALNLQLINEVSSSYCRRALNEYLTAAGLPACPVPIMAEREAARLEEEARRELEEQQRREAQRAAREKERAQRAQRERHPTLPGGEPPATEKAPWGTPQARREAMIELQRQIEESRAQRREKKEGE